MPHSRQLLNLSISMKIIGWMRDQLQKCYYFCIVIKTRALKMVDDKNELKARVERLIDDVDYYLLNYKRLIQIGYSKLVLDDEIQLLINEIKWLSLDI